MPPGPGTAPPRYRLWLNSDRIGQPALCINTGEGDCWGYTNIDLLSRWVHVVAVFGNGRTDIGSLYVDGVSVAMSCVFGTCDQVRAAQNPVTLASNYSDYAWHGVLDEVELFSRELSEAEAASLYDCSR